MAEIGKFVFTDEGRRMLVAQNGGIHFAVMGAILLTEHYDESEIKGMTWEALKAGTYGTLGFKGISYTTNGGTGIMTNDPNYADALEHVLDSQQTYLFETVYQPDLGVKDKDNNVYGLYSFSFDRTKFTCDDSIAFHTIILMGKQYVTDYDAKYNIDNTQLPTVVGALSTDPAEEEPPLAEFEADNGDGRNKYTAYKFEWRITVTENPLVDNAGISADVLDSINSKFVLTNDGIKTDASINLAMDEETIHDLSLNEDGNFATTKSVLIANAYSVDQMDESLNAPGMLHIVNRHIKNEDTAYKPQQVISTYSYDKQYSPDTVDATHVIMSLTGEGDNAADVPAPTNRTTAYNMQSPVAYDCKSEVEFSIETLGENIATNLFGSGNSAYDASNAMFIDSDNNIDISKRDGRVGGNVYIGANENTYKWEDASIAPYYRSVFMNSDKNYSLGSNGTFAINSRENYIDDSNNNILIGANKLKYLGKSIHNVDICTDYSRYVGVYFNGDMSDLRYASTNVTIKGLSATIKGASHNFMAKVNNCSALSASNNTIINCTNSCVKYDNLSPELESLTRATINKTLVGGIGLKGMGPNHELIMGQYNAPHYTYGVIYNDTVEDSYAHDARGKWCGENIDSAPPVSSVFTIGGGGSDVLRRNALEFGLIKPSEYSKYIAQDEDSNIHAWYGQYDYKAEFGNKVGHLTTDIVRVHDAYFIDDPNRGLSDDYDERAYGIMTYIDTNNRLGEVWGIVDYLSAYNGISTDTAYANVVDSLEVKSDKLILRDPHNNEVSLTMDELRRLKELISN